MKFHKRERGQSVLFFAILMPIMALFLLGLEEILAAFTLHGHLYLGLALLAVVLFAPRGLAGLRPRSPAC